MFDLLIILYTLNDLGVLWFASYNSLNWRWYLSNNVLVLFLYFLFCWNTRCRVHTLYNFNMYKSMHKICIVFVDYYKISTCTRSILQTRKYHYLLYTEKGRDLTRSYYKNPVTHRKNMPTQNRHQKSCRKHTAEIYVHSNKSSKWYIVYIYRVFQKG